jgi:hypothetical protein
MANRFTLGAKAIAECDICGFRFRLKELKALVVKTKMINVLACRTCWSPDHPQLQLGMYPVSDPQAVRNPRPDFAGYVQNRDIQWGWSPVGGSREFDTVLTPNYLMAELELGSVTVT